jgi:PadR family transcriptional regulator PadR
MAREPLDLLPGTVDLLILKALSWEPMHGYGVSREIRERTKGELSIEDAALYKALHRLEAAGDIESEWGVSENNRRAKFYRLTADGRARLRTEAARWQRYGTAVLKLFEPA